MAGAVRSPLLAAAVAAVTVALVVLLARPADPLVPPLPPDRSAPDRTDLSLDRCATALVLAGTPGDYPDRADWRPVARTERAGVVATVLDGGALPFVCVTGPTTVDVSDPAAARPIGAASLLLTASSGVVAVAAPPGGTVTVSVGGQPRPPARYVVVAGDPVAPASTTVDGVPVLDRAPPALHVEDRRVVPVDRSAEARNLLERCLAAGPAERFWVPAQVLALPGGGDLLVVTGSAVVGGCVVPPGPALPVEVWRIGGTADGPRPFVWLPGPGTVLPGLDGAVAGGPVQDRVVGMEVSDAAGRTWAAAVAGGTFVTIVPDGVDPDPRRLVVRAVDADGRVIYDGPAA